MLGWWLVGNVSCVGAVCGWASSARGVRMEGPVGSSVQARVGLAMVWTLVSLYDAAGGVS